MRGGSAGRECRKRQGDGEPDEDSLLHTSALCSTDL